MVSRSPRRGSGGGRDDAGRDPALDRVVRAARDTAGEMDTATLEATLAAYRVAGNAAPAAEPVPAVRVTRRHRVLRAVAATTIATKVVLGLATAAAIGGIGVAVTETVHRAPPPVAPTSSAPPAPRSPGPGSGSGASSSAIPSTTPSPSPSQATDTTSTGASATRSPGASGSGSGPTARRTPSGSATRSASPSRSGSGSRSPEASGLSTRTASPDPTR